MTNKFAAFAVFFFFSLSSVSVAAHAASGNIRWHSFEEGMALAEKKSKKVFLHFWSENCPYCIKMEVETFNNTAVIAYLNKYYISIKVNTNQDYHLANQFEIRGVPDNWFIDENGQAISNRSGFIPADMFLPVLKFIHTDSYKKMSFGKFLQDK